MRSKLLAATALTTSILFLVPGAFAQSSYDWGGAYVGVTVGGVGTTSEITTTSFAGDFDVHGSGWLAGITAGYNFVLNENFVVGIEGDASFAGLDIPTDGDSIASAGEKLDSLLSLRARAGLTTGPLLTYATLGIAGGQASYSTDIVDLGKGTPSPSTGSGFVTGVIGGAGMEVAVNDNVSVKLEGLMYQMSPLSGSGNTGGGGIIIPDPEVEVPDAGKGEYDSDYKPSGVVIRSGVNFRF